MTPDIEVALGPTLDFLRVLWRVNHGMERRSRHMLTTLGITAPQRMVLRMAGRFPGVSATQLAGLLHIDPGTLSAALGRLERGGLLVREPDPEDARRVRVSLTKRGLLHDKEAPGTVESAVAAVVNGTTKGQMAQVARILTELAELLETAPDTPDTPATGRLNASIGRARARRVG